MKILINTPIKFVLIGCIGASIELFAYAILVKLGIFYFICNLIGYHIAIISTFYLHNFYTFSGTKALQSAFILRFVKYISLMYAQLLMGSGLLILFIEYFVLGELVSKIIQMLIVVPTSYFFQKLMIFK